MGRTYGCRMAAAKVNRRRLRSSTHNCHDAVACVDEATEIGTGGVGTTWGWMWSRDARYSELPSPDGVFPACGALPSGRRMFLAARGTFPPALGTLPSAHDAFPPTPSCFQSRPSHLRRILARPMSCGNGWGSAVSSPNWKLPFLVY
jgi:hypothetical protein